MKNFKESYLHFIWKYSLFDTNGIKTNQGDEVKIIKTGTHNQDQGPDFLQVQIQIGQNTFFGHVEIHIDNKNWYEHNHQFDTNYDNTVLHVVYYNTNELYTLTSSNTQIPILCLENYIDIKSLENLEFLMTEKSKIPCQKIFKLPDDIQISQFKTRLFSERIIRKSAWIKQIITENNNDYETSLYQCLFSGFGIKVNADIFLDIAKSLPQRVLAKHIDDKQALEALLFGQANLLDNTDEYASKLWTEYTYYKSKYNLTAISNKPLMSKMLPGSFPSVRLAQFAAFIYNKTGLFSKLTSFNSIEEIRTYFEIEVSEYWKTHYNFSKKHSKHQSMSISDSFFEKLVINIILPFKFLIEIEQDRDAYTTIELYHQLSSEINQKTKRMTETFSFENKNAFDSQALNEWYTSYCLEKKCLECTIGLETLRNKK